MMAQQRGSNALLVVLLYLLPFVLVKMHLFTYLLPHPILDFIEPCLRLQLLHLALHLLAQLSLLLLVAFQLSSKFLDLLVELGLAIPEIPRGLFEALLELTHLLVVHGLPL